MKLRNLTRSTGFSFALLSAASLGAQHEQNNRPQDNQQGEWEQSSPYYEDDAWYDITEWFDGNDYNPVDESMGQDEEEWDTDWSDQWWGYDSNHDDDDWFYDYYDDGYMAYGSGVDGVYPYSWNYYDYDQDGFYDAYGYYRDTDSDGLYDDFDYYSLNDTNTQRSSRNRGQQQGGQQQGVQQARSERQGRTQRGQQPGRMSQRTRGQQVQSSRQRQVTGTIRNSKQVSVRDHQHQVVKLQTQQGRQILVDLGPRQNLQQFQLQNGDPLTVRGPVTRIGERQLLLAQRIQSGDRSQQITRIRSSLRGEVTGVRSFDLHGTKRQMAILDTGDKKWLLDLGRQHQLEADLNRGERISVEGIPTKRGDKQLLLVTSVQADGQRHRIDRSGMFRSMNRSGDRSGEVDDRGSDSMDPQDRGSQDDRSGTSAANRR